MAENTLRLKVEFTKRLRFRIKLAQFFIYLAGKSIGCKSEIGFIKEHEFSMCPCWLNVLQFPDESAISEDDEKHLATGHADYCTYRDESKI
jgi:hypothetical protein